MKEKINMKEYFPRLAALVGENHNVIVYIIYYDKDRGEPRAIVEYDDGIVKSINPCWLAFVEKP